MYDPELRVETARLILRPPCLADLDAWADFMGDPRATLHLGGVQPRSTVWRSLAVMVGSWTMSGFAMFSVLKKDSGEWIGRVGPWCPEGWPGTEVGWGVRPEFWGRGYATEAAIASIDWAFTNLGWTEVVHAIAPENAESQAVARRLGSSSLRATELPPPFVGFKVDIWGQSREQWQAQRARLPLQT